MGWTIIFLYETLQKFWGLSRNQCFRFFRETDHFNVLRVVPSDSWRYTIENFTIIPEILLKGLEEVLLKTHLCVSGALRITASLLQQKCSNVSV